MNRTQNIFLREAHMAHTSLYVSFTEMRDEISTEHAKLTRTPKLNELNKENGKIEKVTQQLARVNTMLNRIKANMEDIEALLS